MKSNAPKGYICPICLGNQGIESDDTLLKQDDLVYKDSQVKAWINSFWIAGNEGHVIVVPNEHYETLLDLPPEIGSQIFKVSQKIALAMKKVYECDGITLRQNNEPAGDQHAFHYHMHIFPRYVGDTFNINLTKKSILSEIEGRKIFSEKLKGYLQ